MNHKKFEDEDLQQQSIELPIRRVSLQSKQRTNSVQNSQDGPVDPMIVQSFTQIKHQRTLQRQASQGIQSQIKNQYMERGADISVNEPTKVAFIRRLSLKSDEEQIQELMSQDKKDPFAAYDEHRIPLSLLMSRLTTDSMKGLTDEEATKRNLLHGDNKLSEKQKQAWWVRLLLEMTNPFAIMLWVGAALCIMAYVLQPMDKSNVYLGLILILVVLITGFITYQQTAKSEALMESFKNFLPQSCTVIRGGVKRVVPAEKLVCGDVVEVKQGDKVPADVRILQCREMRVDNSCLTGESEPSLRSSECTHPQDPLETRNLAFFGTLVREGTGKGVVVKIGDATVLGQIANLASSSETPRSPLRLELDRFVLMITIIAVVLGVAFFLAAWLIVKYDVLQCIIFGIGILVANVPEGLLGCITISLAITAKRLSLKQVLVKNLEAVETLGSTSCICSDKTGTLTQNKMTVENIWYDLRQRKAHNQEKQGKQFSYEYNPSEPTFTSFQECAMITSEAVFDMTGIEAYTTQQTHQHTHQQDTMKYLNVPVIGDATETALIKFFQPIEDIAHTRSKRKCVLLEDQSPAKMTFNSNNKYALTLVEHTTPDSLYCVLVKGAPEKVWSLCNNILVDGEPQHITPPVQHNFDTVNATFANNGERVLGFARLHLPRNTFPHNFKFNVNSPDQFNFPLVGYTFLGLISVIDPPKDTVPFAVLKCQSAGIKVIMVTGDQPATAAAIARQVNIITEKTVDEVAAELGIEWDVAFHRANAIVIHGERITRAMEEELLTGREDELLMGWCRKPQVVFARTSPAQKLRIVKACQRLGYIVAVTGDGVNDSPAIKQADIGISMGISGSDVTQDAADMILLNDDFASIVDGIEEGRKIFDNLKKTIVYLLTSNCTEIIPFIAMVLLGLPLPLSSVFMLVICVGTDILPALSLAYEDAELDIMTRKPRTKEEHLVSQKLLVHSYLLMGWIATSAGFMGYFTTMQAFGFTPQGLMGLNNVSGFTPVHDNTVYAFDANSPVLGNHNLDLQSKLQDNNVCTPDINLAHYITPQHIDWLWVTQANWDLRNVLVKCVACSPQQLVGGYKGQYCYEPTFAYQTCTYDTISPITQESACYSTEALKYGQSSYFVAVVIVQWSNIFACKTRRSSFVYSVRNNIMLVGIVVETLIAFFICYTPGVQYVFGGRPLAMQFFGVPGLPFSMMLLLWEEVRKHLIRTNTWYEKHSQW